MHNIMNLRRKFYFRILIILKLTQGCCLNCGHLSVGHLDTVIGIPACGGRAFFLSKLETEAQNAEKGLIIKQSIQS